MKSYKTCVAYRMMEFASMQVHLRTVQKVMSHVAGACDIITSWHICHICSHNMQSGLVTPAHALHI